MSDDGETPKSYLKLKALSEATVQPVVCLGDSLTRGNLSADWVSMLREGLGDGPVLVGTNDLKAELSHVEGYMYRVFGKLPSTPSLELYESTLLEIRDRLVEAGAKVA